MSVRFCLARESQAANRLYGTDCPVTILPRSNNRQMLSVLDKVVTVGAPNLLWIILGYSERNPYCRARSEFPDFPSDCRSFEPVGWGTLYNNRQAAAVVC